MRKIIWNILAVLAVINLIWLFVFNYKIPGLPSLSSGKKDAAEGENVEEPLPEEEVTEDLDVEESEAETEMAPGSEEIEKAADEEPQAEAEAAPADVDMAETTAEETEDLEEENDGLRRCRINDGYNARIRSGPGMDYEIVTEMESGSLLVITGDMEDGWYPVRSEDGTVEGYIYSDLVFFPETE